MNQFDDPDQAISVAAILLIIGAALEGLRVLAALFRGVLLSGGPLAVLAVALAAGQLAAGIALPKGRRWAWPLGLLTAVLSGLLYAVLPLLAGAFTAILSLLFYGFAVYLLTRPAVRQRFGVR